MIQKCEIFQKALIFKLEIYIKFKNLVLKVSNNVILAMKKILVGLLKTPIAQLLYISSCMLLNYWT